MNPGISDINKIKEKTNLKEKENNESNLDKSEKTNTIKNEEKIEIIKTYSIEEIEDSENDNQKLIEDRTNSNKEKPNLNTVNKQIINTLDSINSESLEKENEKDNSDKNIINKNNIYFKPKKDNKNNIIHEKDLNFMNYEQKNNSQEFKKEISEDEKNIIVNEKLNRIDMNNPKNMNKILKLIKYKNPLNIYLKKWRNILPSNEREIERNDIIKKK